jgi:acyl carrier protein
MELNQFIEKFAEQLEDTDPSTLNPDTAFRALEEWSSLTALSIIAMVDEEYEVVIKGDDIRNASTIHDLFELVKSRANV